MTTLKTFRFGTVVCDGCAKRFDSHDASDEFLRDVDDLREYCLEDAGWVDKDYANDKWLCPTCAQNGCHPHPGEGRIIVENVPLFGVACDKCGKGFENYEGFSFWDYTSYAKEEAREDGWVDVGGQFLCPDCYRTCDAIEHEEVENYEEVYCSKCPYKDDCDEVVPNDVPEESDQCNYASRNENGTWVRCQYLKTSPISERYGRQCLLPKGEKCPRVVEWETKGKAEIKAKNAKVRKECHLDPSEEDE